MPEPIRSTYRLQLTPAFGFAAAGAALPYLKQLGITHLYLSPIFRSRQGSEHGYDVTSHSDIDAQLGGEAGFEKLVQQCRQLGMGLVLDIVPNHMAVMTADNSWWMDVLEHGAASMYADAFDIDWTPGRSSMRHRLLVPALAGPLGEVIARGEIRLQFDAAAGALRCCYQSMGFPLDPQHYPMVLQLAGRIAGLHAALDEGARLELAQLQSAFAALPPAVPSPPLTRKLRSRDAASCKQRLAALCRRQPALADAIGGALEELNRAPQSHGAWLPQLLQRQPWRLAYWQVSGEEINYRRFFDVNELAALRMEDERVFEATHALVRRLWHDGAIDGLRVDHADGLYDPAGYFARLRRLLGEASPGRGAWIVAEKILGRDEKLPRDWEVDGTTGYEFAALVTGWLMHPDGVPPLVRSYARFVGERRSYEEIAHQSRRQVMRTTLAAEISGLAARLDRVAQLHQATLDFTLFGLREAIVEVLAHFPVYRTYLRDGMVDAGDALYIRRAVGAARGRKQAAPRALDFLESVLLGEFGEDPAQQQAALEFAMKFQQVSAPVMAKGIEDTACYRYSCLLAMNEVGADPQCQGFGTEQLHRANLERLRDAPRGMLASSTHDTKRGEDARHRLCALTENTAAWDKALSHWRRLKRHGREAALPDAQQQYLLLQSLLAIWPPRDADTAGLRDRLRQYAVKAAREAKEHTSWLDPDPQFESVLQQYVEMMLPATGNTGFARYFGALQERIAHFGLLNSLSATVLKLTVPGVPDTYQGNELPAFVLVDPDNRRTPDFAAHAAALDELQRALREGDAAQLAAALLREWRDGRLKLFITWRLLQLRRRLENDASYLPLMVRGPRADHLCAFARLQPGLCVVVVVSRWAATLSPRSLSPPVGSQCWGDTRILLPQDLPAGGYVDALTGRALTVEGEDGSCLIADLLEVLPVCVLVREGAQLSAAGGGRAAALLRPASPAAAASGR